MRVTPFEGKAANGKACFAYLEAQSPRIDELDCLQACHTIVAGLRRHCIGAMVLHFMFYMSLLAGRLDAPLFCSIEWPRGCGEAVPQRGSSCGRS